MRLKLLRVVILLAPAAACFDSGEARTSRGTVVESSAGTVALGLDARGSYRRVALSNPAALQGTVSLVVATPRDSVAVEPRNDNMCADSTGVAAEARSSDSERSNVLVWVDGVATGKALPEVRREMLTIEGCRFEPRIMAVVAPSTINVFSRDGTEHQAHFYREGEGPIERVRTVDAGQVVPSERIAAVPGIVEVRCTKHPGMRSYVAVFEHPYFAVTDDQGAFRIDSLPPGTYTVKVWHERLARPAERRVVVRPGGAGQLDFAITLGS